VPVFEEKEPGELWRARRRPILGHPREHAKTLDDDVLPFLEARPPEHYLGLALKEAEKAFAADEVPVGAVIVDLPSGQVVARAHNQRELLQDPTAHAEVLAITQAAAHYGSWRLTQAALFVTLEPCTMCAGAIVLARLPRVYYAADDPKAGAHRSVFQVLAHARHNHVPEVVHGVRAAEASALLQEFFRAKRARPTNGGKPGGE
jgi:tRNA(adenine34) deaminase